MGILLYLLITCALIQIIYLVIFFIGLYKTPSQIPIKTPLPPVSVIIAAHNEGKNLEKLLHALLRQQYPDFEIILADDRSDDNTSEILETLKDPRIHGIKINAIPDGINSKKYALTKGIEKAKNDVLLFIDGDCYPESEHWIAKIAGAYNVDTDMVLGYSPYEKRKGLLNTFIQYETAHTALQYISLTTLGNPYMGVGRNLSYRKSFFQKSGGFEKIMHLTGGDDDLFVNKNATSKNTKVIIDPVSWVRSYPKESLKTFLSQKLRHLSAGKKYKAKDKIILGLFTLTLITTIIVGIGLLFTEDYLGASIILVGRWLALIATFSLFNRKFSMNFSPFGIILLDILYSLYYLTTSFKAILAKNIPWI